MDFDFLVGERRFVPVFARRQVRVLVEDGCESVQLAIISTRGNAIESVSLDRGQLLALIGALHEAQREAEDELIPLLKQREVEAEQRYRDALDRNPWLCGERDLEEVATYRVVPR